MLACDIGTFKANIQGNYERRSLVLYIEMIKCPLTSCGIFRERRHLVIHETSHFQLFRDFIYSFSSYLELFCEAKQNYEIRLRSTCVLKFDRIHLLFVTPIPNQGSSLATSLTGCFCWPNCSVRWTFYEDVDTANFLQHLT